MLFKKGDREDPKNYRGISLVQVVTKIFTQILLGRLEKWSSENNHIPEFQAGFRQGRGCTDHIFTLSSIVKNQTGKGNWVHTAFVDFTRAFDSIDHTLLWDHLLKLKMDSRYVRLLQKLYNKACMCVRTPTGLSKEFQVTQGVLQGEILSPFLFSLYINDLEDEFTSRNLRGVQIDSRTTVHLLAYADDVALLGDSRGNLQQKLKLLEEYCLRKGLTVNIPKTKVMTFNKSGRLIRSERHFYRDEELEVVAKFQYLGVVFIPSGLFHKAVQDLVHKGNLALGSVWSILVNSRMKSWDSRCRIFDSLSLVVVLYSAAVWGPWHVDDVNKFQNGLFKSLLRLPRCTPGYLLRLETGREDAEVRIWRIVLRWWLRLLSMEADRYPRRCFEEQKRRDRERATEQLSPDYQNWATRIRLFLEHVQYGSLWLCEDLRTILKSLGNINSLALDISHYSDRHRVADSSYSDIYRKFEFSRDPCPHLCMNLALEKIRIVAQLHLNGNYFFRIISRGEKHTFQPKEKCSICTLQFNDDMFHFLFECTVYSALRSEIQRNLGVYPALANFHRILIMRYPIDVFSLYNFVRQALNLRAWSLRE